MRRETKVRLWALAMVGALVASCGGSDPNRDHGDGAAGNVTVSLPPPLPVAAAPEPPIPREAEAPPEPEASPAKETPAAVPKVLPKASPAAEPPAAEAPEPETELAEPAPEPAENATEPDPLPEASPPIAAEGLAGYIRGAGFQCDRVVATRRAAGGPYKFDCGTGGSYRGTMRRGRLYFRPWSDRR